MKRSANICCTSEKHRTGGKWKITRVGEGEVEKKEGRKKLEDLTSTRAMIIDHFQLTFSTNERVDTYDHRFLVRSFKDLGQRYTRAATARPRLRKFTRSTIYLARWTSPDLQFHIFDNTTNIVWNIILSLLLLFNKNCKT